MGQDQMDNFSRDVGGKESNGNARNEKHGHRDEECFDGPTALDDSITQLRKEVWSIEITQTNTQRRKDRPTERGIQELRGDHQMAKCTCHRSLEKGK